MNDWFPKRGEMVFSTPVDVPLNHLTRLEEVVSVRVQIVTISGRVFWHTLRSIDDISLEYGVLELRQVTPERMAEFNQLRLLETTEVFLCTMDWEKFVRELDSGGMVILQAAVQKIKSLIRFTEPVKDNRPVAWLYFKGLKPRWVPSGAKHLIETVEEEYMAEMPDGSFLAVPQAAVKTYLKHDMLRYEREPLTEAELQPA